MGKVLITADNLDEFLAPDRNEFYVDPTMILTPGAKDELSKRKISLVHCPDKASRTSGDTAVKTTPAGRDAAVTTASVKDTFPGRAVSGHAFSGRAFSGDVFFRAATDRDAVKKDAPGRNTPGRGPIPGHAPTQGAAFQDTAAKDTPPVRDNAPCSEEDVLLSIAAVLQKDYGVTDPARLRELGLQFLNAIRNNL